MATKTNTNIQNNQGKTDSDILATSVTSITTHTNHADTQKPPVKPQKAVSTNKKNGYTVQWKLNHNNQSYLAGSEIELDNATAEPLLAAGVLVAK